MNLIRPFFECALVAAFASCGGGGGAGSSPTQMQGGGATPASSSSPASSLPVPPLTVASGLKIETIAHVDGVRELATLPNGDLIAGTTGSSVYIIPSAEGNAGTPRVFATLNDSWAEGVAFDPGSSTVFVGSEHHVWSIPYRTGDVTARSVTTIASVRTGPLANPGDGDVHNSTSVAVSGSTLYASMGSSCNGCTGESDPTRAAIWKMHLDGSGMTLVAKRIRNAIAVTVDPASGHLWAGGAGQDSLPAGHPYEFIDDVTAHTASSVADYGWPYCEENHRLYNTGPGAPANCDAIVQPLVEFPAYITHIGAVFYPANETGAHALPQSYRGALLVTSHGSWHTNSAGCTFAPEVDAVAMNGDTPATAVDWSDPTRQYRAFVGGFQPACSRVGRPTGITVGPQGSVFIGDDAAGAIYRVRP